MAGGEVIIDGLIELGLLVEEEVIGGGDNCQLLWLWDTLEPRAQLFRSPILVLLALHDELVFYAAGQYIAHECGDRHPHANQLAHTLVGATDRQSYPRAEGETCQAERQRGETPRQFIERGTHVVRLAAPFVKGASATPDAAKIEPEHRHAEISQRLRHAKDHLIVHGAAAYRMWVADQRRHPRLLLVIRQPQQSFQHAVWRLDIECLQLCHVSLCAFYSVLYVLLPTLFTRGQSEADDKSVILKHNVKTGEKNCFAGTRVVARACGHTFVLVRMAVFLALPLPVAGNR